jgi:hypothetical protein
MMLALYCGNVVLSVYQWKWSAWAIYFPGMFDVRLLGVVL